MKERNKELIKNTSLLMLGNIGSKMLSFILIPIYTSILTTSEYGIFDLLSTTESFLIPILTLDIGDAVFRYGIDEELNTNTVFNSGIFLWFSSVFFAIVLTLFVQNIFDKKYCLFVLLTFIFATVYKGNIIKSLIMDCQSYTKYRPNETTGGIFVSWRRKEELPTGA